MAKTIAVNFAFKAGNSVEVANKLSRATKEASSNLALLTINNNKASSSSNNLASSLATSAIQSKSLSTSTIQAITTNNQLAESQSKYNAQAVANTKLTSELTQQQEELTKAKKEYEKIRSRNNELEKRALAIKEELKQREKELSAQQQEHAEKIRILTDTLKKEAVAVEELKQRKEEERKAAWLSMKQEQEEAKERARLSRELEKESRRISELAKREASTAAAEALKRSSDLANNVRGMFSGVLATLGAGFGVQAIYQTAQQFGELTTKLKLIKADGEDVAETFNKLLNVANNAKQPVEAAAQAYETLKKNTLSLGISQERLIELTSTMSKAIAIGGSSAEAAKSSMIQFGQALSMGKLSGQNLNSVMEQTPGLIEAIAQGLGLSSAQLKEFANSGKLTTEVIVQALEATAKATEEKFNSINDTINGSLNILKNNLMKLVGQNDFFSGTLAKGIKLVAENMNILAVGIGLVTARMLAIKAIAIAEYLYDVGKSADKGAISFKAFATSSSQLLTTFKASSIAAKSASVAQAIYTGAVGATTVAWRVFNTVVKASVLGAVLSAGIWMIEKLIDGVKWLYQKWKEWKGEVDGTGEAIKKGMQEGLTATEALTKHIQTLEAKQEQLNQKIKETQERYTHLQEAAQKMGRVPKSYLDGVNKEVDSYRKQLESVKKQIADAKAEQEKQRQTELEKSKQNIAQPSAIEIKTPTTVQAPKDNFSPLLQRYTQDIAKISQEYENLRNSGTTALNSVQELQANLLAGGDQYKNLTQSQIDQLTEMARKLDEVKEKSSLEQFNLQHEEKIKKYELELSLVGMEEEQRSRILEQYELENQARELALGKSQEYYEFVLAKLQEEASLRDKLKEKTDLQANSFSKSLEKQKPTLKSFQDLAVSSFNKIGDAIVDSALDGSKSFADSMRSMAKEFIKTTLSMLVRMALLQGAIMIADSFTAGGFSAALKIAAAGLGNGGGGNTNGFKMPIIPGFASGGYTGDAAPNRVTGVVHGQEFVLNSQATKRYGLDMLNSMNNQTYKEKIITPEVVAESTKVVNVQPVINVHNYANAEVDVEHNPESNSFEVFVRSIAREEAFNVHKEITL